MFKLINKTDVTLRSLSITDVDIESYHAMGEFTLVYRGRYKGQQVALKKLDKEVGLAISRISTPNINSFYKYNSREDLYRHALAWRSLVHKFILPLVGIFGDKSEQFLVSPFMTNGTLTEWRKNHPSLVVSDIHRIVRLQRSSE